MTRPEIAITAPEGAALGPLLVLGPSLGTSTILWEDAEPALKERYRVATWDLPGHGRAPSPSEGFSVGEVADAVADAVRGLGEQRVLYAGVSLGGAVGLELLLRHPDLVTAAAIVCSGAKLGEAAGWHDRARQVREQGTASLVSASAGRWFAPESIARRPELSGRLLHALRDADDEGYARCCEALADFDARDRLSTIAAPVLAVWGEYDAVTPEASAVEIASSVQDGRAVRIADAAHLAPAEQPEVVARELVEFFDAAGGGKR
jgi:3-oxoadipate enol-lactonase